VWSGAGDHAGPRRVRVAGGPTGGAEGDEVGRGCCGAAGVPSQGVFFASAPAVIVVVVVVVVVVVLIVIVVVVVDGGAGSVARTASSRTQRGRRGWGRVCGGDILRGCAQGGVGRTAGA